MKRFLVFYLNDLRMALPMDAVERVFRAVYITPLPDAPEIVLGVINAQGRVIPVMDMHGRMGLSRTGIDLTDQLILAHTATRPVALVANRVSGVEEYPGSQVTEASTVLPDIGQVAGVVKLDDGLCYIYDLERFLSLDEARSLDRVLATAGEG